MRRTAGAAMAAMAAAGAASAAEGPSFDCAGAEGAAALVCEDPGLSALDRRLAGLYRGALVGARGLDTGAAEAEATLKAEQRGWIKGRDDCWKAADQPACVREAYERRAALLVAEWMLETPSAVEEWRCGGAPGPNLTVMAFTGDSPAGRLEYGDRVEPAQRFATPTGARYDGSFGVSFAQDGDAGRLEWPQGTVVACGRD
jgi:uncharacterized protein